MGTFVNIKKQLTLKPYFMKRLMIILAAVCFAASANAQELTNFFWGRKPIVSPEVKEDSVTFRLRAEYATDVKMYGSCNCWSFNGWRPHNSCNYALPWSIRLYLPDELRYA